MFHVEHRVAHAASRTAAEPAGLTRAEKEAVDSSPIQRAGPYSMFHVEHPRHGGWLTDVFRARSGRRRDRSAPRRNDPTLFHVEPPAALGEPRHIGPQRRHQQLHRELPNAAEQPLEVGRVELRCRIVEQ